MRIVHHALVTASLAMSVSMCSISRTRGDEGMWLFNDLPREALKEKYGFEATPEWADHVMKSSVRFSSGGSASFVSSDGLVITNHHVAADTLHKLSTPESNYYDNGFLADSRDDEIKAPDLELNQLISIEDVTDKVNAAVTKKMEPTEANKARQAAMAKIEQASLDATGLRSDVITLFGGAKYHLYRYKKYTDVRLVWAPEATAAFFGGDMDNFEYPRYCLDATLFRVYEDGKPAKIDNFLKWSENGAADGELVFVSGNPGRTDRGFTTDALKFLRDYSLPYYLNYLCRLEVALQQYCFASPEHRRRGSDDLFGVQNSRKAITGMLSGLQSPRFMEVKTERETELLKKIREDSKLKESAEAWNEIAEAQKQKAAAIKGNVEFRSTYYKIAQNLVLIAGEDEKPSGDRFKEFRDSGRESLEYELFSPAPLYDDLEIARFATQLAMFVEERGGDDPLGANRTRWEESARSRNGTHQRIETQQGRIPTRIGRGRNEGDRSFRGPADSLFPRLGIRVSAQARTAGIARRGRTSGLRPNRRSPFGHRGNKRLSRCDVHLAIGVRRGEGLRGRGEQVAPLDHHGRGVRT